MDSSFLPLKKLIDDGIISLNESSIGTESVIVIADDGTMLATRCSNKALISLFQTTGLIVIELPSGSFDPGVTHIKLPVSSVTYINSILEKNYAR